MLLQTYIYHCGDGLPQLIGFVVEWLISDNNWLQLDLSVLDCAISALNVPLTYVKSFDLLIGGSKVLIVEIR